MSELNENYDSALTTLRETFEDFMEEADVGISTHSQSAFGDLYFSNKLVEFLTQGLPVLTSRTKTVQEYLPEDSVFYFNPGDENDCARQIIKIFHEPDLVRKKLEKSKTVVECLNWQLEKQRFIETYRKILGGTMD